MTPEQLQERLSFWQARLRLQDWKITATIEPYGEMPSSNLGRCSHDGSVKVAKIQILNPADAHRVDSLYEYDPEETLIHELLHLHMRDWQPDDVLAERLEFAINALAEALLKLAKGA